MFENFYLNFEKIHPNAIMPQRANSTDAGMDVYTIEDVTIAPGKDALIPLGLKCEFPRGYSMIFKEKSGRSVKDKLSVGACPIGSTLINTNGGHFKASELSCEFVESHELKVLSYDLDKNLYDYAEFDGFRVVENASQLLEITYSCENLPKASTTVSFDHQFFDFDLGWVKAMQLKEGSVLNHIKILNLKELKNIDVYSTNVKKYKNYISYGGFINHNCVVDSEYRGELMTHVFNNSDKEINVKAGEKITQFVVVPVWVGQPNLVESVDKNTDRGTGGFGSSGII
jgi:dUTPase